MTIWLFKKVTKDPRWWPVWRVSIFASAVWKHTKRGNFRQAWRNLRAIPYWGMWKSPWANWRESLTKVPRNT